MDSTLVKYLYNELITHFDMTSAAILLIGVLLPVFIGMLLPRKGTVVYGMVLNKFLGLILLQKRIFKGTIPGNILQIVIRNVQTTFQDMSFGIYLDSRKDLSEEDRKNKIKEYLAPTKESTNEGTTE